ncbi:unnamed protein product [Prunus armeniaca]|uniref:Uncharacterized protein n=1 Tax=Prunus armeniaca TaxID=36596 RepID=A0A6J5U815_PRUAR|nr:unnamed protein product [Prunus armeniaca]
MVFERIKKVDEINSSIHEMIPNINEVVFEVEEIVPKVKTFLDNTNGIIEALPTKRQLGLEVLGIGLIVGIAIWLYNGNALDKKASKEKKANKDEKAS